MPSTPIASQTAPPWPPTPPSEQLSGASICEPYRDYVEAQLRLKRNAMAIYQGLVDQFGFAGAYNSVKRFAAKLRFPVLGSTCYRKPRLFLTTLRYSRRSFRRVVWKSRQETWVRLHEQAWRYVGGSWRYVVLDNLKANLPPCLIGMEACSGVHHWSREFARFGHTVRMMAPKFVVPYRMSGKRGKNDAADAAAICEAVTRPNMRFVPAKSIEQQSRLFVHRARQG